MESEDYLHYWCDLYPYKNTSSDCFLFEIKKENSREEYYYSVNGNIDYEVFTLDTEEQLIDKKMLTQKEILKIIKENIKEYWARNVNVELTNFSSQTERSFESNYIKHKLYVAGDYHTIIKIIINALSEKEYYHYSPEEDRAVIIKSSDYFEKNKIDPFHFSITSYIFRTEFNEGFPGCLITVENIPARISLMENLKEPVYDWVFERLEDIPCIVEFDFNFKSYYNFGDSVYKFYVTPFYLNLCKNNIRSLLFSIDDEAFYIKTNPLLNENERLLQLEILTGRVIDPNYLEKLEKKAKKILGAYWEELTQVTRQSLIRGIDVYETDRIYNGDILDSSPASIQFAKCIETEIEQKLLLPYRKYFIESDFKNLDLSNDLNDTQVSKMTNFLTKPKSKAPELGTFAFFLSNAINSRSRVKTSITIKSYLQYILFYKDSDFLKSKEFYDTLILISTKYRNGAAHTKALPYSYLLEFYEKLIGENRNGFLFILIDALRKK